MGLRLIDSGNKKVYMDNDTERLKIRWKQNMGEIVDKWKHYGVGEVRQEKRRKQILTGTFIYKYNVAVAYWSKCLM